MKPIGLNDRGVAVEDIQRRLRSLGLDIGTAGVDGVYLEGTAAAVRAFRVSVGLPDGDIVDDVAWSSLVDATFSLGDRTLYLRIPYFHGHDVAELQSALNVLGFACGEADGIFGAHTERALREFQTNAGMGSDGIAGSETYDAIGRLRHVWEGKATASHSEAKIGFARAAEVLEGMELCFFGTDPAACGIAARISNLARATTERSKVVSADSIDGIPPETMVLVQISTVDTPRRKGLPLIVATDPETLPKRIKTAVEASTGKPPRICIEVLGKDSSGEAFTDRDGQAAAISLLDAFCVAFG